jgi:hypothetical protein
MGAAQVGKIQGHHMKLRVMTLLVALALAGLLAIAGHHLGCHSTPGILLAFANLPGCVVAAWVVPVGADFSFYALCTSAIWTFYFLGVRGVRNQMEASVAACVARPAAFGLAS